MKYSFSVLAAVAAALVPSTLAALDPYNCNGTVKERDGADFILVEQADNKNVASLAKIFAAMGKNVSVAHVFNDGNHQMTTDLAGRKHWEELPDYDDANTKKWMPQGVTGTWDALDVGTYEGKDGWLVSWYTGSDDSVRISFVDKSNDKYRNALLVYPHAADDFREVPIHAGGIVWYGNTLWAVDTNNGIRVFDMSNIWQVTTGDNVGKNSDGSYSARGYKYVIPQIRWYKWSGTKPFRHSYVALDRTTTPDSLIVGEYQSDSDAVPVRVVRYPLDYTTRRLRAGSDGKTTTASWAYCLNIDSIQGIVSVDGKFYISSSNGEDGDGDLFAWRPGSLANKNTGFFPPGPEDLTYDKRNGKIYTATEHPGKRYIVPLDIDAVKF
ncbi:Anchored cell wall protein 12 [Madurella fahalii]|uniref:Anchored cell wall protein 12 n=1 Tax=Madurella fahalii TaxID=1157608 RepID=A0ABQ0GJ01_9PEZI